MAKEDPDAADMVAENTPAADALATLPKAKAEAKGRAKGKAKAKAKARRRHKYQPSRRSSCRGSRI